MFARARRAGPARARDRASSGSSGGRSPRIFSRASSSAAGSPRSYHLDRVGLRTQEVSNLVIGDPKRPDLVASYAHHPDAAQTERQLRGLSHRRPRRPAARAAGPRQGQLGPDRQDCCRRRATSRSSCPISCSMSPTAASRWQRRSGRSGSRSQGNGNLSGGFKGRAAIASPQHRPRAAARRSTCMRQCRGRRSSRGARTSTGRSRSTASSARPATSTSLAPRFDAKASFNEAFTSIDGSGRMAIGTLVAGANGLANFVGDISLQGLARRRVAGGVKLSAQNSRMATILRRPHAAGRRATIWIGKRHVRPWPAIMRPTAPRSRPAMLAGVTEPLAAAAKTPIGPVATSIGNAISRTARNFNSAGQDHGRELPRRRRGADQRRRRHRARTAPARASSAAAA